MNKKKVLLVVLAMVLVCVMSVMGTMALLAEQRGAVTNTFVAGVAYPAKFVDTFEIKEYQVEADDAGYYDYVVIAGGNKVEVDKNEYIVTPGVVLPKDAFVKVTRTNETPAYLFIKVANTLDSTVFTMNVDTTVWTEVAVPNVTDGKVYVLSADTASDAPTILGAVTDGVYHIIDGNKVVVADNNNLEITADTDTIAFYAYICQATVANTNGENTSIPAEVFDICF